MGRSIVAFSVILLVSVLWKPAYTDDKCSLGCKGSSTTTFLNGHKYTYGVESTVSIFLSGADSKETTVKLLGQVVVNAIGNCVNELVVQNLAISGPDGKKYPSPPGIEQPVQFALYEGKTDPEICAVEGDTRRSLNIKRAIISLMQTQPNYGVQTDVFGVCPTDASSSKEGKSELVHRSRDLNRCSHREQGKNDMVTAVYNPTAEITSTQVLHSTLNVESKVTDTVPEKVAAIEEYLYKPFSVGENGARAKVHTKLTLTNTAAHKSSLNPKCSQRRTIMFETPHEEAGKSNANAVHAAVRDTAKAVASEASSKSAGQFAQLIRIMRSANKDDLLKVFNQVKGNNVEKRVFLDGLFRAGSGASVEASVNILKQGQLSNLEEEVFYLTLAGARHVNNEAVKAAASLIDRPQSNKKVYIGLGALAGVYCRNHDCHSGKSSGVAELSQKFGAKLNCRAKDKAAEDEAVFILKGIRNIRHLEDSLIDKVVRCASDAGVKPRVRVAALEAYLADPCSAKLKKSALDIMKNRQLDSEIRIKAYLAVIGCPCGGSANEISKLLENEPVHQVGRFISTSIRHIRASTNPDKKLAKLHYGLIRPPTKFNVDDRKYSFYREASFNVDALGLGGNVEETVIYSQDSFLPRSASLNLTAELFGHSLNVLEVGGRQGNLDRVAEHIFGPRSIFRTKKPQDIYDELKKTYDDTKKETQAHLSRGRRSVKVDVDNFDKHLKEEAEPYNNELELDVYLKLFGTDALYLSFGDDKSFDFHQFIQKQLQFGDGVLNKLKNFQHELRSHLLFLDAQLTYPTSTGFPLKLNLVGAATARVDIGANIDVRQILKSPQNAKVDIKLVPSSDIEIAGILQIDADVVSTGLKVVTNLHSSTGAHVIAQVLENGNGFDLQLGLPIEKQEILTASHDLVYFTAEKGQPETHVALKTGAERKDYSGCFDQLSGLLGLTLCGELSVPFSISGPDAQASISSFFSRYPLTGVSKVKLVLEKNDLRGYHVKGVYRVTNDRRNFELLFEAEGSKNRRTQITGELVANQHEKTVILSLDSPIKKVHGQVSLYTKPSEYALVLKGKLDNDNYYGKAGFSVQGDERRSVFRPVIEYEMPQQNGKKSLKIDGEVIRENNQQSTKYTLQGVKVHLPNAKDAVDVNGHLSTNPQGIDLDLKAKQGEYNCLLGVNVNGHDFKAEFQNNLNPVINFRLNGHVEYSGSELIRHDFDLTYGGDLRDPNSRVIFNQLLKTHYKSAEQFNVITKNKFEILALPLKLQVDGEADPKKLDVGIKGQYFDKHAGLELEARTQIKKPGDYHVKMSAEFDKQGIEVLSKRDIINPDKSNFENYIQIKNIGKYELSGVVLHKNRPNDRNIGAIGHLKVTASGKNEDIKFDVGMIENNKLYSSHAKITYSKGDLLDYLLKVTRGANANGQLKFILKDTVSANGQFKVTDGDGKGNGMIIVDFKKSQRKIRADVKFVAKEPVFNADVTIFLNFEKDSNDKIHFTTDTKRTANFVDTKNKLEYGGKKAEVNVRAEGSLEGKSHANVEVVLPTERCLSLKVDRDIVSKDNVYNGNIEVVLSDAEKRGAAASKIAYKGKIINSDVDKGLYHYEGQVDLALKNGKNLQNQFILKNSPKDDKYNFYFKSDLTGNLIPQPASLFTNVVYNQTSTAFYDNNLQMKGNYGNDYAFEVTDIFQVLSNKYVDDFAVTMRLPLEKAHDIKFVSNVLFVESDKKETEYTIVEYVQVNAEQYKIETNGKFGLKEGYGKAKVVVPHNDPFILEGNYEVYQDDKNTHFKDYVKAHLKTQYGKGKTVSVELEGKSGAPKWYNLGLKLKAPHYPQLKSLVLDVSTSSHTPDSLNSLIMIDVNDGQADKYEFNVVYSKVNPMVEYHHYVPTNAPNKPKDNRVLIKGSHLSSTQGKVEVKIENIREVDLDAVVEGNVQKDNVAFKLVANSQKLGLKNYKVDISSKDAGSGKRLEFHAENDNKNVLSGSTSFISKQEGPKTIIEGSGSVKVKEEQKSANFKYIRTVLTEGNEQGIETFLNVAIGERSYVAESRVTNVEYKTSYVYCEEKKQCANAEFHSKLNLQKPGVAQHIINVVFDLRKLGIAPEFGLEINSEMSESKLPQYSLDLHVNKEDRKYHFQVYSKPTYGRFPAGVVITLPHRVLAIEALVAYPTDKALPFPIKAELFLHPDKNHPQQKSGARFVFDVTGDEKAHAALAEVAFSHPKLGKEAVAKVKANLAVPDKNSFKYESSASISHPTIGGNRESKIYFEVNPAHVKLYIETPLVKVIDIEGSATVKENLQQADARFSLLEGKPVSVRGVVKDFQYYEFTTEESDRKLSIVGHLQPEKRVDISADIILGGEKKNIVHGALFLQDNLVKSDYGATKENFNYFINALKNDLQTLEKRIKQLGEKASSDFKATLQRVKPTLEDLTKSYQKDIEKLYEELANDKVLKDITLALDNAVQFIGGIISDIVRATAPIFEQINKVVTETVKKIEDIYASKVEPQIKQLYATAGALLKEFFDGLLDLVAHFAAIVTDFFEKHKAELQELTNTLAEIFKDLTRLVVAQLKELRAKSSAFFEDLSKQIKELPIFDMIKEKYQELAVPDVILDFTLQLHNTIQSLLPTPETKEFSAAVYRYLEKKRLHEKLDENAEMRALYQKFTRALTSLVQFVRAQLGQFGVPNFVVNPLAIFGGPSQTSPGGFGRPPAFSFINQLLNGDVDDPHKLLREYRVRSLNPLDEYPAKLRAFIVNGQHIFTFDGRHMTFPGACRYVLAHDYVDRNFTIVLQLAAGAPKAIGLVDKSGKTVEIKDNGQVAVDGATHGFPVIEGDMFAFREPNGRVGFGSRYGVLVRCSPKLEGCLIEVSGFYLGKLRGLLGDGNNEPFDDFRLPNGKISTSESEFGNAYRLATSCPQVKTPEHSHHQMHGAMPPACEQVFGGTSPLKPLSLFMDVAPFRQACAHAATGADALQQACDLARGYTALAITGLLPAVLPSVCVQCQDADKPRNIGDTYEFKLPNKQADIVVTVETTVSNEKNFKSVVIPLVSQLVDNLKSKKIADIKVYLVGITSKMPYPIVYDTDLKLKNAKVQFDDESRYQKTPIISTGCEQADKAIKFGANFIDTLRAHLGLTNVVAGYESVLQLPLRPGAIKHTINVVGERCYSQFFLVEAVRAAVYETLFNEIAYTHSLVAVTDNLQIGSGKNAAQVVGFTEHSVLMLGDKKFGKDTETLRSTLEIPKDSCIDFVESTGGFVFSANNYQALDAGSQKQFVQSAAGAITARMTRDALAQECTCAYADPFRARSVCVNKDRKEAASRRK
ncbi:apolipophorins isoform X2 [Ostrinia nubilalis]|uniref:apolipophorins isoform X2 n=1 Tax=Ostrinia nubilalis TaxID=29057 RepID=UPI003082282E